MEKFFLGTVFAGEQLDVVDQEGIDGPVAALEFVHFGVAPSPCPGRSGWSRCRGPGKPGSFLSSLVAERVHQVGLSEPGATVDEQGVINLPWV